MPVSEATYERIALEDPESNWELVCGRLRRKPEMTQEHNDVITLLGHYLQQQLPLGQYTVRTNMSRTRLRLGNYYVPDVSVIPESQRRGQAGTKGLETYDEPLPLVVEVWSPSTGEYDVTEKLAGYRERGDAEIWLVHPYERTITAWRRRPDGSYQESRFAEGEVQVEALPGVTIRVASLFR